MGNNSMKIIIKMMLPNPRRVFTSSEKKSIITDLKGVLEEGDENDQRTEKNAALWGKKKYEIIHFWMGIITGLVMKSI